jgi:hypothetical protein
MSGEERVLQKGEDEMKDRQALLIVAIVAATAIVVALICNPPYHFDHQGQDTAYLQLRANRWTGHVDVLQDDPPVWKSVPR